MKKLPNIFIFLLSLSLLGCLENVEQLNNAARNFVSNELNYTVLGVSCMNRDKDNDGYVSCTVRVKEVESPLAVECASRWAVLSEGCRMQKLTNLK